MMRVLLIDGGGTYVTTMITGQTKRRKLFQAYAINRVLIGPYHLSQEWAGFDFENACE